MNFAFAQRVLTDCLSILPGIRLLRKEIEEAKLLAAKSLVRQIRAGGVLDRISDAEFKVFSQFGDDGIIQYLIRKLKIAPQTFVEFGVENYTEANTRFLLVNDNWKGLVMDGGESHIASIRSEEIYWRHDLTAACEFVTRENINALLAQHGFEGDLGILSIDIDGNDYWVWERIEVVRPHVVIVEYNSVFGNCRAVSIPYDPRFVRTKAHFSNLYWGCSLPALAHLAEQKGFAFVGCNTAGNNAYFVRKEQLGPLRPIGVQEGFVQSKFRESRGKDGELTLLSGNQRAAAIADLPVVDVLTGETITVGQAIQGR